MVTRKARSLTAPGLSSICYFTAYLGLGFLDVEVAAASLG